jgi:dTDP-4-amino-4,6-dideoxygalactose transaminase
MIKFNTPFISGDEIKNISELINLGGPFYGHGKFSSEAVNIIRKNLGDEKVILTDSCTSALDVIALLIRQRTNKNIILCPSYTFSSTASAFLKAGFKVQFVDINPTTLMVDEACLNGILLEDVAALAIVHYAGQAADIFALNAFCKKNDLFLVEDAAQSYGCRVGKYSLGTIGDFAAFSFHETKNIHSGLGGALVVKNTDDYELAQYICDRGSNRSDLLKGLVDKYTWVSIGGSYTLSELSAAFLLAQLKHYEVFLKKRRSLWCRYFKNLQNNSSIVVQQKQENVISNYHAFFIIFENEVLCEEVRLSLIEKDINAYIGYVPLHASPFAKENDKCINNQLPVTELVSNCILRLPLHDLLTIEQVDEICAIIN